jgi:SAM-dependent methyltransferase
VPFVYRLLYLLGFTPWDTGRVPDELTRLVEGDEALAPGRVLDIGCGTGTQSVYLAEHGWQVTGVDAVEKPLRRARSRGEAAGASVQWVRGDVTRLHELGLKPGYTLFFDRGCFHGLSRQQRLGYAAGVSALAEAGATLLMMAFAPNNVPVGPGGVDQMEVVEAFAGWELASADADSGPSPDGPLGKVPRSWYRFTRPATREPGVDPPAAR